MPGLAPMPPDPSCLAHARTIPAAPPSQPLQCGTGPDDGRASTAAHTGGDDHDSATRHRRAVADHHNDHRHRRQATTEPPVTTTSTIPAIPTTATTVKMTTEWLRPVFAVPIPVPISQSGCRRTTERLWVRPFRLAPSVSGP